MKKKTLLKTFKEINEDTLHCDCGKKLEEYRIIVDYIKEDFHLMVTNCRCRYCHICFQNYLLKEDNVIGLVNYLYLKKINIASYKDYVKYFHEKGK